MLSTAFSPIQWFRKTFHLIHSKILQITKSYAQLKQEMKISFQDLRFFFKKKTMNSIIILLEEIFNCSNNYPHHSQNSRRKLVVISAKLNLFKMAQTKCKILLHESDIQAHPPLYIYISRILQIIPKSYEEMSRIIVCQKKILHEFGRIKVLCAWFDHTFWAIIQICQYLNVETWHPSEVKAHIKPIWWTKFDKDIVVLLIFFFFNLGWPLFLHEWIQILNLIQVNYVFNYQKHKLYIYND